MNQLFQQLNQQHYPQDGFSRQQPQNNKLNSLLKQTFQKVKMMANPMEYINNLPEMQNVLNLVQQNGGNAQQLFYKLAEQKGVDPNSILDIFK